MDGFLRGFGAWYFDGSAAISQAIHIDLFPFVTVENFGRIKEITVAALFVNGWAQRLVGRLVKALSPNILILFGRTNCGYFARYIDPSLSNMEWKTFPPGRYFVGHSKHFDLPVVGLSTNLGNPKGFSAVTLKQFGQHVQSAVQNQSILSKPTAQTPSPTLAAQTTGTR